MTASWLDLWFLWLCHNHRVIVRFDYLVAFPNLFFLLSHYKIITTQSFRESETLALFLSFVKFRIFLHQEYTSSRFFYMYEHLKLTWVIRMLSELFHPALADQDHFLWLIIIWYFESLFVCLLNNILHVLWSKSAQNTKEKLPFWKLSWELFFIRKIFLKDLILNSICVKIFNWELLIVRDFHSVYIILFKMKFFYQKEDLSWNLVLFLTWMEERH